MNLNHANPNREPRNQSTVRFVVVWLMAGALPVITVAGAYKAGWVARGRVDRLAVRTLRRAA